MKYEIANRQKTASKDNGDSINLYCNSHGHPRY